MAKENIKSKLSFFIILNNDRWKVNIYTEKNFIKLYGNNLGLCEYCHTEKLFSLNFRGPKISKDTIAHELTHAYLSYHDFSRNKPDTIEEKMCEVNGKHHAHLFYLVNNIHRRIKKIYA